jgi:hypothetical protein
MKYRADQRSRGKPFSGERWSLVKVPGKERLVGAKRTLSNKFKICFQIPSHLGAAVRYIRQ